MPRLPILLQGAPKVDRALDDLLGTDANMGAPVTAVLLSGQRFVVATGHGRIAFADHNSAMAEFMQPHGGSILSAAATESGVFIGTDDGRALLANDDKSVTEVWREAQGQWVDHVVIGPHGSMAWSSGKFVYVRRVGHADCRLQHPSTLGGLAFAPLSDRLAASHYGGVTIWDFSIAPPSKRVLEWKGMHLDLTWSRDERFIVTAMLEAALHGWRLADAVDFQMSGYRTKPRSMTWSKRGDWLATSGANEILLWSFKGKKGPMGTSPVVLSRQTSPVSQVAFHPFNAYVAAGLRNGAILLARQDDLKELVVRRTKGGGPVTGLAWSPDGRCLAFGTEDGRAGVVDFGKLESEKGRSP